MNYRKKYLSACIAALLVGAAPAFAADAPSLGAVSSFAVLSAADGGGGAVTCTDSTIDGDVGSSGTRASVTRNRCKISGAIIAPVSAQVVTAFDVAYAAFGAVQCPAANTLTGTLAGITLTPGVYCFDAAAALTGTLTLNGGPTDTWLFKIGNSAVGALAGTDFTVLMAGGATECNVTWWVNAAVEMTRGAFNGTILAGAAITFTGTAGTTVEETYVGRALAKAAVTLTDVAFVGCEGGSRGGKSRSKCNQGVGNGPENCDPGNSNQDEHSSNPFAGSLRTNDECGGKPGSPGRLGGNICPTQPAP